MVVVEDALNTLRGGTSDHSSEDLLHREWGDELKAPSLNASSEYGGVSACSCEL